MWNIHSSKLRRSEHQEAHPRCPLQGQARRREVPEAQNQGRLRRRRRLGPDPTRPRFAKIQPGLQDKTLVLRILEEYSDFYFYFFIFLEFSYWL